MTEDRDVQEGVAGDREAAPREPDVLVGEDELPRQPAPPRDPFTPEPGPRPGERRAFRVMWVAIAVLAVVVAIVVLAAVR